MPINYKSFSTHFRFLSLLQDYTMKVLDGSNHSNHRPKVTLIMNHYCLPLPCWAAQLYFWSWCLFAAVETVLSIGIQELWSWKMPLSLALLKIFWKLVNSLDRPAPIIVPHWFDILAIPVTCYKSTLFWCHGDFDIHRSSCAGSLQDEMSKLDNGWNLHPAPQLTPGLNRSGSLQHGIAMETSKRKLMSSHWYILRTARRSHCLGGWGISSNLASMFFHQKKALNFCWLGC